MSEKENKQVQLLLELAEWLEEVAHTPGASQEFQEQAQDLLDRVEQHVQKFEER